MKIRTDFVTNSSSSSFSVSIVLTADTGEYSVSLEPDEDGCGKADLRCTASAILKAGSVGELAEMLRAAVCDREEESEMEEEYKAKMDAFAEEIKANVPELSQIEHIRFTRRWEAWGEAASCLIWNDDQLQELAAAVCESDGAAREEAVEALKEYLDKAEIFTEGGWSDPWPSKFMGSRRGGKYVWDGSVEELAKLIYDEELSTNDDAIEVTDIHMGSKKVEHRAEFRLMEERRD